MSFECNDTNVPSTDETQLECCEFYNFKCILTKEEVPCLGLVAGDSLELLANRLCSRLNIISDRLDAIEQNFNIGFTGEVEVPGVGTYTYESGLLTDFQPL